MPRQLARKTTEWAYRTLSHRRNGVYGAMFTAAISAAFAVDDPLEASASG